MLIILDTTLRQQCYYHDDVHGFFFWTAGHRMEPSRNTEFIWKVKSSDANIETLSVMK